MPQRIQQVDARSAAKRSQQVKALTVAEIESAAIREVEACFPDVLKNPHAVPILRYLDILMYKRHGFRIMIDDTVARRNLSGNTNFHTKRVELPNEVYDGAGSGDPRHRFTAAHEIAHVNLHAPEMRDAIRSLNDGACDLALVDENTPQEHHPEWQANLFACAFLMPRPAVSHALTKMRADRAASSLRPHSSEEFISAIAKLFCVTPSVASFRLEYLRSQTRSASYTVEIVFERTMSAMGGLVPAMHAFRNGRTLCGLSEQGFLGRPNRPDVCRTPMCLDCQKQITYDIGGHYESRYVALEGACGCSTVVSPIA